MAPATQHPGVLQSRDGWWRQADQGLYQKEPRARPDSPSPADLKEPLLLLRADPAARVGQAGNSGPRFSPFPIPPRLSSLLGLTLTLVATQEPLPLGSQSSLPPPCAD